MELLFLGIGLLIGGAVVWLLWSQQRKTAAGLQERLANAEAEREAHARKAVEALAENRFLQEKLTHQKEEIEALHGRMTNEFKVMADTILEEKSRRFTQLNGEQMGRILSPLQEKLAEFRTKVEESYDKEARERFSLDARIKELVQLNRRISEEASNLTKALKGESKTQGDWGEMILENILRSSGLREGSEYFLQETLSEKGVGALLNEAGKRMRPDVVVRYPDGRCVIIDSKVSLTAYSRYCDSDDEAEATRALTEHHRSLKAHIDELAGKSYQDYADTLDSVMMFVPNEPAYLAAMQRDPGLFQYAYGKRVLLMSPTNLIPALKLVEDLWKREYQNRNALEIAERGAALYDKFAGLVESMDEIGANLERTRKSYDKAFGQLNRGSGNLIGQVEKLRKLGLKTKKELPASEEE